MPYYFPNILNESEFPEFSAFHKCLDDEVMFSVYPEYAQHLARIYGKNNGNAGEYGNWITDYLKQESIPQNILELSSLFISANLSHLFEYWANENPLSSDLHPPQAPSAPPPLLSLRKRSPS